MKISKTIDIQRYYKALLKRDSQYVGIFYVGVKTTGVFCISICRARKPKMENVVFYTAAKDTLLDGFRPCKVCKPTENGGHPPEDILSVMTLVSENPAEKISDRHLRERGHNPERVRRWFKSNYAMTFQTFQRMLRINTAYQNLKNGRKVTESAFQSGYESLSGFGYAFKNMVGLSPENAHAKNVINITRFATPIGSMFACATSKGVSLLEFTDRHSLETELEDLCSRLNGVILQGENSHLKQLKRELKEYFDGERKRFSVPLDTPGTGFQVSVWKSLLDIPYGECTSYKNLASITGNPKAVRAVASANGQNKVSILIPCHRVIGENGHLTGYGGGLPRKKWLLEHEKTNAAC